MTNAKSPLILLIALICMPSSLSGCATCKNLEQRCNENVVQLCDTAGKWRTVMDCDKVQPASWKCRCGDLCTCKKETK